MSKKRKFNDKQHSIDGLMSFHLVTPSIFSIICNCDDSSSDVNLSVVVCILDTFITRLVRAKGDECCEKRIKVIDDAEEQARSWTRVGLSWVGHVTEQRMDHKICYCIKSVRLDRQVNKWKDFYTKSHRLNWICISPLFQFFIPFRSCTPFCCTLINTIWLLRLTPHLVLCWYHSCNDSHFG